MPFIRGRSFGIFILHEMTVAILAISATVPAQYFGRNKVQYERFRFQVMNAGPFSVHFYPEEEVAARDAATMLLRWDRRFSVIFDSGPGQNQPVVLYADHADFQQTNVIPGRISQGVGGITEGYASRVVVPLTGVYAENDHVLGHELVHVYHYARIRESPGGLASIRLVPLWLIEGMSEYLSVGSTGGLTAMWLRDALFHEDLPSVKTISTDPSYFPYRFGHALWAFVGGVWGDTVIPALLDASLVLGFDRGLERYLGITADSLTRSWHASVRQTVGSQLKGRTGPSGYGHPVITGEGGVNIGPVVSPDGKKVAFFSRRDVFHMSLYIAEASTGRILKRLSKSETDAHFDALNFMNGAGAWSPEGDRFAFPVYDDGDNAVHVSDVSSGRETDMLRFPGVSAISGIAWSPDGKTLAISGTSGGISDLFLYDFGKKTTVKITDDRFAELQPAWSPDGGRIAFCTDNHPCTDFDRLVFSRPQIGIYDLSTGRTFTFGFGPQCKHISPQFTADGNGVYFIADPDGISDIYRYSLDEGTYHRITRIATGVSGLTELSPALSAGGKPQSLVFNVFEHRKHHIYRLDQEGIREVPVVSDSVGSGENAALLPPGRPGLVDSLLAETGYDYGKRISVDPYTPRLTYLALGNAGVGTILGPTGASLGGGAYLLLSDLLGNNVLGMMAQVNGSFQDVAASVLYQNRERRLNWGTAMFHIPNREVLVTSRVESEAGDPQWSDVERVHVERRRIFYDGIDAGLAYPLNVNRRFELSLGYTRIWWSGEGTTYLTRADTILESFDEDLPEPSGLDLGRASASVIGDFSVFGLTGPIAGSRYRVELEPNVGTLNFFALLADYRRYISWKGLTVAGRIFHYGRYLGDSGDERLSPLHLGYPGFVRGYEPWSFDLDDCESSEGPFGCAEIDRFAGSRIAVANVELRIPLVGVEGYGLLDFAYLPTDFVLFTDFGAAWDAGETPGFLFDGPFRRSPVWSTGFALRMSILGALVVQLYFTYPYQRSEGGWRFGWVLEPGW